MGRTTLLTMAAVQCMFMLAACRETTSGGVRESVLAGSWYPASKAQLQAMIDGYLADAKLPALEGKVVGMVSPHAGYVYSGRAAAYGFKAIKRGDYDVVVVMGPSHTMRFAGASIPNVDAYHTPLGLVKLDRTACDALLKNRQFVCMPQAHQREHSVEIELPFLQRRLGDFKLVPMVIGYFDEADMRAAAAAIKKTLAGRRVLYVASSDFTHYGARFDYYPFRDDVKNKLRQLNMGAVDRILDKDLDGFLAYRQRTGATICGYQPIGTLLAIAEDSWRPKLLKYYTSGDLTGEWDSCVSYVSLVFTKGSATASSPPKPKPTASPKSGGDALSPQEQDTLLRLARATVESYVRYGKRPEVDEKKFPLTPRLKAASGVFVTLKKHGQLRGCIGHVVGRMPLYQGVIENAINAAARDPRFMPVRPDELGDIDIEVSVLTPFQRVKSAQDFIPGKHGIYIKKGWHSAVYLPQVAAEQGWDRATTLSHLCRKAGLAMDEWQKPGMEFNVCTGQYFGEKKH